MSGVLEGLPGNLMQPIDTVLKTNVRCPSWGFRLFKAKALNYPSICFKLSLKQIQWLFKAEALNNSSITLNKRSIIEVVLTTSILLISTLFESVQVIMDLRLTNQQVTNVESLFLLVGTSEAVCPQSYYLKALALNNSSVSSKFATNAEVEPVYTHQLNSKINFRFNEWLAGLIDGDGCLLFSKAGYCSCEITVALADEPILVLIQNKLGGSIKRRAGVSAVRYRLHNTSGFIDLINRTNGLIRNSVRVVQLQKICAHLNITYIQPVPLSENSCWYAGFFDAEGCITFSMKPCRILGNKRPQLSICVSNKREIDLLMYQTRFGGSVYYDSSDKGSYKWYISSKSDVECFLAYAKVAPVRSIKVQRLHLVPKYYELVAMKAFRADAPLRIRNAWTRFMNRWGCVRIF